MGVKLNTASSGSVSIEPTNTASNYTLTVPAQTGTVIASDSSGNVNIDSNTLYVDATNDRVGIGTSSPDAKLDVLGGGLTSSSIAITNNDNATISANYSLVFQADRNNNIGGRSFDWKFGGKGYSDGTVQMYLTQAGNLAFNSGYGSAATAYGCRAWVNFNGTGTVAIRSSGNVSSITDNGTGNYRVNITNAMPDTNYILVASGRRNEGDTQLFDQNVGGNPVSTSAADVRSANETPTATDFFYIGVAIFR